MWMRTTHFETRQLGLGWTACKKKKEILTRSPANRANCCTPFNSDSRTIPRKKEITPSVLKSDVLLSTCKGSYFRKDLGGGL